MQASLVSDHSPTQIRAESGGATCVEAGGAGIEPGRRGVEAGGTPPDAGSLRGSVGGRAEVPVAVAGSVLVHGGVPGGGPCRPRRVMHRRLQDNKSDLQDFRV